MISPSLVCSSCRDYIAFIVTGSTEYHGGCLPLSIDTLVAMKLLDGFLERFKDDDKLCVIRLPPIYYGYSIEWSSYVDTLSISYDILYSILYQIYCSLEKIKGFRGLVIVNGHGGNKSVLEILAREITWGRNSRVVVVDIWSIAKRLGLEYCHACVFEVELAKRLGLNVYGRGYSGGEGLSMVRDSYAYTPYPPKPGSKGSTPSVDEFIKLFYNVLEETVETLL